jgi:hypothetical protein
MNTARQEQIALLTMYLCKFNLARLAAKDSAKIAVNKWMHANARRFLKVVYRRRRPGVQANRHNGLGREKQQASKSAGQQVGVGRFGR